MPNQSKFSKILHIVTICCFFLPFFYTGCQSNSKEVDTFESDIHDTTSIKILPSDTLINNVIIDSSANNIQKISEQVDESDLPQTVELNNQKEEEPNNSWSNIIVREYDFLKPIMIPEKNTYSGVAIIIDSMAYIPFISSTISLLFLILSLFIKKIERNAIKSILVLELTALVFLLISMPLGFNSERLWGYWITVSLLILLVLYDYFNRFLLINRKT